jgi:hypothetical protein
MKHFFTCLIGFLVLTSCQSIQAETSPDFIAQNRSCAQIAQGIAEMDGMINSNKPSPSGELVQNTAVSAAQTGLSQSGAFGTAGPFAGLGMNFLRGLYSINAAEQRQKTVSLAHGNKVILLEAYEMKACP